MKLEPPDQPSEEKKDDRSKSGDPDRSEIKLAGRDVPPPKHLSSEESANESADDSEEYGDDTAGGVPPWHQKFRQGPGDEAEKNPV